MPSDTVCVTGGAGYVGSALVPAMLERGYRVRVLDLFIYGKEILDAVCDDPNLEMIEGDIRDRALLRRAIPGCDTVIHLACISNDPSFELNPALGRSINFEAFGPLVEISRDSGVRRFIYASSSSVYGIKQEENVDETMPLEPLTDYSRCKAECEEVLARYQSLDFCTVTLRPATVCGYAPRQRLDVIVNILTNHAYSNGVIRVIGGDQKRPNIHIKDMVEAYLLMLELPDTKIAGEIFNVGHSNHTVKELADIVKNVVGPDRVRTVTESMDDKRSYHISSDKITRELGYRPRFTVGDAVRDLVAAFEAGSLPNSLTDSRYFNIKRMQEIDLK